MDSELQKRQDELRRKIDEKIDQYNKSTFPASDAPQWDSLKEMEAEMESLATTSRSGQKEDSADQRK